MNAWARHVVVASAAIAFILALAVVVYASVGAYAERVRNAGQDLARTAPQRYTDARPRFATPGETLAAIAPASLTPGWRLRLDAPPRFQDPAEAGQGPPGHLPIGERPPPMGTLAAWFGITPIRIPLDDATLSIVPDLDGYAQSLWLVIGVVLVVTFVAALALIRLATILGRAQWEPLVATTTALQRLAGRDFTPHRIVTNEGGPIGELARAYNDAAEQVAIAIRERDAAEAEMQRFLADAGHELRTPVTIIMGYLEILRGMTLSGGETADRVINGMQSEMGRMRSLIEKLIVLSRLESTPVAHAPVDVVAVAAGVRESLVALAGRRSIDVAAPPAVVVSGDENDLHEALANLVENALKYAPASDVRIEVSELPETVRIVVADRGPGMDAIDLRRAFERFYRGAGRSGNDGSGLGLAIVKRAIERSGGTVSASSNPGDGARFTIDLPRPHLTGAPT